MWSTLMLVCLVFGDEMLAADANVNITYKEFRPLEVSSTTLLNAGRTEDLFAYNQIICAMLAAQRPWSHLMCYGDNLCQVHDLLLPASHLEVSADGKRPCYTDLQKECVYDGDLLEDGETVTDSDCMTMKCSNSVLSQAYPGTPITCSHESFEYVPGVGCLGLFLSEGTVPRNQALSFCVGLGATLVIPEIFEALQDYLSCKADKWFYVGAIGTSWDDGTPIDSAYWRSGPPTDLTHCVYIAISSDGYLLESNPCDWGHYVLCQLP